LPAKYRGETKRAPNFTERKLESEQEHEDWNNTETIFFEEDEAFAPIQSQGYTTNHEHLVTKVLPAFLNT
jgi:hypothetical protein